MAWCHHDTKPLPEPMMTSETSKIFRTQTAMQITKCVRILIHLVHQNYSKIEVNLPRPQCVTNSPILYYGVAIKELSENGMKLGLAVGNIKCSLVEKDKDGSPGINKWWDKSFVMNGMGNRLVGEKNTWTRWFNWLRSDQNGCCFTNIFLFIFHYYYPHHIN